MLWWKFSECAVNVYTEFSISVKNNFKAFIAGTSNSILQRAILGYVGGPNLI